MKQALLRIATLGLVLACAFALAGPASAQNLLTNPGFEPDLTGWTPFANAYASSVTPLSGAGSALLFGPFNGGFGVSGVFQEFAAVPGEEYSMSSNARHNTGDAMVGIGAASCGEFGCTDNWMVQKIAFFDAGNNEIGAAESVILDGSFALDTYHASGTIMAVAPANTVKVQALILYLQGTNNDGGAGIVDDIFFELSSPVPTEKTTWGGIKALYSR